jgi:putative ABC transport system substrate-binding protein
MQFDPLRRREFVTLLGGAAAAWPLAARAQQEGKVWRIGLLSGSSRSAASSLYDAFVQGMRELGYVEGPVSRRKRKAVTVSASRSLMV